MANHACSSADRSDLHRVAHNVSTVATLTKLKLRSCIRGVTVMDLTEREPPSWGSILELPRARKLNRGQFVDNEEK